MAFGLQLLVHLGPKAVHQHNLDPHALDHGQILRQMGQLASGDGLTGNAHHEGLVAKLVDVGGNRTKPRHKGEIENGAHGLAFALVEGLRWYTTCVLRFSAMGRACFNKSAASVGEHTVWLVLSCSSRATLTPVLVRWYLAE